LVHAYINALIQKEGKDGVLSKVVRTDVVIKADSFAR